MRKVNRKETSQTPEIKTMPFWELLPLSGKWLESSILLGKEPIFQSGQIIEVERKEQLTRIRIHIMASRHDGGCSTMKGRESSTSDVTFKNQDWLFVEVLEEGCFRWCNTNHASAAYITIAPTQTKLHTLPKPTFDRAISQLVAASGGPIAGM